MTIKKYSMVFIINNGVTIQVELGLSVTVEIMWINILKVKKIPVLKFQWAFTHVIWPLSIFFGMLLVMTQCALDFY